MVVKRFDVFLVNLDPTISSEIRKARPCLIISPDEMNRLKRRAKEVLIFYINPPTDSISLPIAPLFDSDSGTGPDIDSTP
jgi:hypothetical protein